MSFYDNQKKKKWNWPAIGAAVCLAGFWICAILILALIFTSCTTTRVVERVRTDTLMITKLQRDSIWLHDSTIVKVKGDTVEVEKWHTKYVEKAVYDTIYKSKTDSIPVPVPVEKKVEKQLSGWQNFRLWMGNIALIAILLFMGWRILKRILKKNII